MSNCPKRLKDLLSPTSHLITLVASLPPVVILFQPTLKEFLIGFVVDTLALLVTKSFESRIFIRRHPETAVFFDGLDDSVVAKMNERERVELVRSFIRFPKKRALFVTIGNPLKVLPCALVITFYWNHAISNWAQFSIFYSLELLAFTYFHSALFLESHIFLSNKLTELHRKFDFSSAFEKLDFHYDRREFRQLEFANIAVLLGFQILLQLILIVNHADRSPGEIALMIAVTSLSTGILLTRVWQLNRNLLLEGLERLFNQMKEMDYRKTHDVLPLHTTPILAQFEKTYNVMNRRLIASEQELSSMVVHEAEKGRYRALGELSAMIAHDLAAPLHSLQFCVDQIVELKASQAAPQLTEYIEQMKHNVQRASDLVLSLRARLRNPAGNESKKASILSAHQHVLKILEMQYRTRNFRRITFEFSPELKTLEVAMAPTDLIHVLENLYRNAVENLLYNNVPNPCISLSCISLPSSESTHLVIRDNGTGLSADRFEELTAFQFRRDSGQTGTEGLGLRLIRRLIELNGGTLNAAPDSGTNGTTFLLALPMKARETETQSHDIQETPPQHY